MDTICIADGSNDGELYADHEEAYAAQERTGQCAYVPLSPSYPWTPRMCEEFAKFIVRPDGAPCVWWCRCLCPKDGSVTVEPASPVEAVDAPVR
jgi:hypothetical protein